MYIERIPDSCKLEIDVQTSQLFSPLAITWYICSCNHIHTYMYIQYEFQFYVSIHSKERYGIRQKDCNKLTAAALISTAYRAPCLSLCVCRTFTLSLKVHRLVKCRNPRIVALFQGSGASPVKTESRCVGKNHAAFGKSAAIRFPHKSRGKP